MVFAAFVIVGTVNAVNITDGVDGLSSSVTVPVAAFLPPWRPGVAAGSASMGVFAGALAAVLGFLL